MTREQSPPQKRKTAKRLARIAQALFTPVAVAFIAWAGWRHRESLAATLQTALWGRLAAAAAVWSALQFLAPVLARLLISDESFTLGYFPAYVIHAKNLPARYIPGGVWHSVGRVAAFHGMGAPARRLVLFVFLENTLAPATAFLLGGILVALLRGFDWWGRAGAIGAAVGAASLMALPLIGRRLVLGRSGFPSAVYVKAVLVMLVFWAGAASAFTVFVSAFPEAFARLSPVSVAGTYLFAWAAGNVAIFAPQGIGVFESVAAGLLGGSLSVGAAAALLASFRGVLLVSDMLSFVVGKLVEISVLKKAENSQEDG